MTDLNPISTYLRMGFKNILVWLIFLGVLFTSVYSISNLPQESAWKSENVSIEASSWSYEIDTAKAGGYGECVAGDGRYVYLLR